VTAERLLQPRTPVP